MITLKKTSASDPDFIALVKELDAYLTITDGDDHEFYDQFNKIDKLKYVIVAYLDNKPVGCGAIKEFNTSSMEVKRMYTNPSHRGNGIASEILQALELWAHSLGYMECILETGIRQVEAISLYLKQGYTQISNYGPYEDVVESLCFQKSVNN